MMDECKYSWADIVITIDVENKIPHKKDFP